MHDAEEAPPDLIGAQGAKQAKRKSVPPTGGQAYELEREDGGCERRTEDRPETRADAAEEQGATFLPDDPPQAPQKVSQTPSHLEGRAFPADGGTP
jgi:hypothetical protein